VSGEPIEHPRVPVDMIEYVKMMNASILIKGQPGTGKTSLAIELASAINNIVIVAKNISSEMMQARYSCLQDRSVKVINVATWFDGDDIANTTLDERVRVLGIQLAALGAQQADTILVFDDLALFMFGLLSTDTKVQHKIFLNLVRSLFAGPCIIINDSADNTGIESSVDCILFLHNDVLDGAILRKLEIQKIRARCRTPKFIPFTLRGGKFACGVPMERLDISHVEPWIISPNPPGSQSTGSEQVDALYKDCLKMASFNLYELDPDMPTANSSFFLSAIINFLQQGHGVIVSAIEGDNTVLLSKRDFMLYVNAEVLDNYYRVLEEKSKPAESRQYIIQYTKRETDMFKSFIDVYDDLAARTDYDPILSFVEYTSYDYRNNAMLKEILNHIKFIKHTNVIEVAIVNSGADPEFIAMLSSLADTHMKMQAIDGGVAILTGRKPTTNHFFIELASTTMPKIQLIEVV